MSENPDRERERYLSAALEDALRSYRLVPEPPTLLPGAMARVHRLAGQPRLGLSWLDGAVLLLAALMGGVIVWLAAVWLPGDWLAQTQTQAAALLAQVLAHDLWLAAGGAALLALLSLVAAVALALGGPAYARGRVGSACE